MNNDTQPPPPADRRRRRASVLEDLMRRGRSRSPDMSRIQYRSRSTNAEQDSTRDDASRPELEQTDLEQERNLDLAREELYEARKCAILAELRMREIDLSMTKAPIWRRLQREFEENGSSSEDYYQARLDMIDALHEIDALKLYVQSIDIDIDELRSKRK
ncbi:hypothetical protein Plec18167_004927 [Paecilomyces lecythidis]|uniref:Uncharacterized protein n=1 Tax=Paecilomyces lecythidis TaxID=3004212 RepID=A0ABR3XMN0_9EURO